MAFSIEVQPIVLSPVFNQLTFRVSSSNSNKTQMRYIFDTYVDGVKINRSKLYPRPDGFANFDVSKILQEYLKITLFNEITTGQYSSDAYSINYYIEFSEEYVIADVVQENLVATSDVKYTYLSVANWQEGKNLQSYIDKFLPSASNTSEATSANYLDTLLYVTNILNLEPNKCSEITPTDKRVITLMTRSLDLSYKPDELHIKTFTKSGENKEFILDLSFNSDTAIENQFYHQPIGIAELNLIGWTLTTIPTGLASNINADEDAFYYVWFENSTIGMTHKPIGFKIVECGIYDNNTILYQTLNGSFWSIPMKLKNFKQEDVTKNTFQSYLPYNYDDSSRVTNVINVNANGAITLNTNWLKSQEQVDEIMELIKSPLIYLIDKDRNYIPIIIESTTYELKNIKQDKLIQYQLSFVEAFNKNTAI